MSSKPLKTELHHWWPRGLAEHWAAADGMVSVIRPNGAVDRAPPGRYGGITNAHHVKFGGPWSSTFEPSFNQADNEIADFVTWLSTLDTPTLGAERPLVERIGPQSPSTDNIARLARITASLLARSPAVRNSIKITTEYYRREFGLPDPTADKTLVAANQQGLYDAYRRRMEGGGRWAILFSGEKELIAGDGFFHNFPASADGINTGKKLVLPILPTAAIVYMLPMSHPTEPRLVTLRVGADEAARLNEAVQVYARDFLFFREDKPDLIDAFKLGKHQIYEYHGHDWFDSLFDDLSQFCQWGPGGGAHILDRRQYSESLSGSRWLTALSR